MDEKTQKAQDDGKLESGEALEPRPGDFLFRGGTTLIFDMFSRRLRYTIRKRITDDARLNAQREFLKGRADGSLAIAYSGQPDDDREPFAMVHQGRY